MSWAAVLLAGALLAVPGAATVRHRARGTSPVARSPGTRTAAEDPLAAASCLEVFAVCLTAGMAVAPAAAAAAPAAPPRLRELLGRAADMLLLGADPQTAWSDIDIDSDNAQYSRTVARLARRSASSGAALAAAMTELAEVCRHDAATAADAAAQRAAVLIAGPLGLCFLPAFVCVGLVPVVVGLVGDVFATGVR
ncbi:MAG: type II secretion system F family protein [Mycobacterium sp.]